MLGARKPQNWLLPWHMYPGPSSGLREHTDLGGGRGRPRKRDIAKKEVGAGACQQAPAEQHKGSVLLNSTEEKPILGARGFLGLCFCVKQTQTAEGSHVSLPHRELPVLTRRGPVSRALLRGVRLAAE